MKLKASFDVIVPNGTDLARVTAYLNDALAIGTEQLDEDSPMAISGLVGNVQVTVA